MQKIRHVDCAMNEYCADRILHGIETRTKVDDTDLENFLISLVYLTKNQIPIGPKASDLKHELYALYNYEQISRKLHPGFDLGAVYGATNFVKIFQDI
jgi:hypothetical protein